MNIIINLIIYVCLMRKLMLDDKIQNVGFNRCEKINLKNDHKY